MTLRPFALERYFARHEFSARYMLGSSDPEAMDVGELLALEPGAEEGLRRTWLGYTESPGDPGLREEIARLYAGIQADQVLVFSGAEEPIFAFVHALLEPGDHLIVHFPSYQSHHAIAEARGIRISRWCGNPARGWAPDLDELERLVRPETKAMLVCTPHNPTGYLFDETAWRGLAAFARKHGLILLADEVYRGTEHAPARRLPAMADLYEHGVSLNGLSKSYGLAGLRLGWIATRDPGIHDRLAAFKDYLTICNSAPSEYLGCIAVRHTEALLDRTRGRLVANLEALEAFFHRHPALFRWDPPVAGTTTFPAFLGGDALAFCERLVEATGILLVPSAFFDLEDPYLRFGYGRANLREVLARLEEHLACFPS